MPGDAFSLDIFVDAIAPAAATLAAIADPVVAFQFLDFPLVLLHPDGSLLAGHGAHACLEFGRGKRCIVPAQDDLQHLIDQVPTTIMLLEHAATQPRLLAQGSVEIVACDDGAPLPPLQHIRLFDQQHRHFATAAVHAALRPSRPDQLHAAWPSPATASPPAKAGVAGCSPPHSAWRAGGASPQAAPAPDISMHAAPDQRPWLLDGSGFDAMASPSSLRTGPRVGWVVRHTSSTSPDRQRPSLSRRAPQPGAAPWLHDGSGAGGSRQLQGLASRHAMGREGSMSARMQPDAAHPGASAAAAERRRTALSHAAQRRGREEAHRTLVAAGTRQHQAPPPAVLPQPQQQLQQAMQPLPPPLPQPSSQPAPHSQQQGQQGSQQQLAAYVAGASESLEPSGPAVHEAVPPVQASAGTQDRPTVMASQQDGACAAAPPQSQQPVSGPASALHAAPAAAQQGAVLHGTGQQVPGQQGVSMTTAVVWELVTLMGMRTILSQAVSAMSEQMGGIVRQALHQQLGGLALNAMPAALASQQAAGAPAAQAAAACATHAAARAGAVAAAAPHAAASAFEGAWQLLPQALPHTGTTHHAGQAAGVSYSTAQAGLTFEEPQLLSYKEGSGLRRSPGSSSGSSDDASADGNAAAGGGGMLGANFAAQMQHVAAAWDDMAVRMVGQLQEGSLSSEGSAPAASFPEAGNGRAALGSTAQRLGGGSHAPASRPVPASMPAAPSLHSFRSGSLSSVYSDSFEAEGSTAVGAQAGASDIAPTAVAAAAGPHALRQQPRGVLSPKRQRSLQRHISELADIPEGGGRALETGSDEGGSELAGGLSSVASSGASSEHADLAAGRGAVTPLGAPHQQWQQQQQQPQLSRVSTLSLSLDSDLGRQLAGDMEPWTGAARSSSGSCNSCNSGSQHGSDAGQHEAVPAPLRLRKVAAAPAGSAAAPVARQHVSQQPRPRRAALQSAGGASLGRSVSQYSDVSFLSSYAASQEGDSPRESLRGAAADPPPWSAGANTGRATASAAASGGDSSWAAIAAAAHAPATSDDASSVGSGSIPERVSAAAAGSGWVEAARPQRLISAGRALQVLQLGSPEGSEEEQAEPASQPSQSAHSWQGSGALAPAGRPKTAAGRASWGSSPMAAATQAKGAAGSSKGSEGYEGGWGGSIKAGNWQQEAAAAHQPWQARHDKHAPASASAAQQQQQPWQAQREESELGDILAEISDMSSVREDWH